MKLNLDEMNQLLQNRINMLISDRFGFVDPERDYEELIAEVNMLWKKMRREVRSMHSNSHSHCHDMCCKKAAVYNEGTFLVEDEECAGR